MNVSTAEVKQFIVDQRSQNYGVNAGSVRDQFGIDFESAVKIFDDADNEIRTERKEAERAKFLASLTTPAVVEPPTPYDGALEMQRRGARLIPLRPRTKIAFQTGWEDSATNDLAKIQAQHVEYPDANWACVAKSQPGGHWYFEIDDAAVLDQINAETGHDLMKEALTFRTRSSPGKGHFHFLHSDSSLKLTNAQGRNAAGKEAWSARVDNRYVVSPLSWHPDTGKQYEIVHPAEIIAAPEWLVDWLVAQQNKKIGAVNLDDKSSIPQGSRNDSLASILGKARQVLGMDSEQLLEFGKSENEKRCTPPLPESEVKTIAYSIGRYAVKPTGPSTVLIGGVPGGIAAQQTVPSPVAIEIPNIETFEYPKFPSWVLKGCSMYDNYIKEVCEKNSRYDYMMFVPGMAILLNYLGTKIVMSRKGHINGAMVNVIGKKGRVIKSSSVQDMFAYFQLAGMLGHYGMSTGNAEGRSLVWTAGSTEGLGLDAQRVNCRNMLLFFDELKTCADKAGIEGSSMGGHLLTLLQSGKFSNTVKSRKEAFHFDPDTYTASVLTCCTDRMFPRYWSRLIAFSDGLEDRATLLLQPKELKPVTPRIYVTPSDQALINERRLINKAVAQGNYEFDDTTALEAFAEKYGNRSEIRAEEWAVAFAVQMGRDTVDPECVERGIALETYNIAVKRYLNVRESETREAVIQNHIVQLLMQNGGSMELREFNKRVRPDRYGTALWGSCYQGLIKAGITAEIGTGVRGDPKRLVLLQAPERDDD